MKRTEKTRFGDSAGALEHTKTKLISTFEQRQSIEPDFNVLDWYVIESNIKCEAKAAQNLADAGFTPYLPKQKFEIIHHRTKKRVEKTVNLFRQYLFVGMPKTAPNWFALRRCEGVKCVLGIDEPLIVPTAQVRDFWRKEQDMQFDSTREARLHRGETMQKRFPKGRKFKHRIADVPFIAQVESVNARGVITAMVDLLGKQTRVKIDAESVAKEDRAA